ncbi:MAG: bile acid:sodium symporter family protein [Alphaproteobacteria bacterium]|nr:bile acid:sodium symporter family protein [Alphaproteobacteria bacterium]
MGVVTDVILPIALAFIMFSLGLGLTFDDFARVAKRPRDFFAGAFSQIILLPLVALILVSLWPLSPELALGVMIIAAAPGGVTSNLLTSFARGDVALSISLTAIISLVSVITIPLVVVMSYQHLIGTDDPGDISVAETALSVFVIVTVPVVAGVVARRLAAGLAQAVEPWARRISTVLFVLVLAGAIFQERDNIVPYFADAGLVTLVLNVVMMALAYVLASILASGKAQRVAISIECGLQNGTLAIAVAVLLFGAGPVVIPAATYSLIMFATSLLFIAFLRRSS